MSPVSQKPRFVRAAAAAGSLIVILLSLVGAAPGPAASPRLLWPLEISGTLLSSFGEYRYDHLHAGIDISTQGKTGYKVLAADTGEVFRLKVEWRGYGRAIYLRHPGGRITVYGHLDRFEERVLGLEGRVARRQAEAGTRYPGDIYLDPPRPVGRGQVIAYSGESGVGLPHLHFEVRDREDRPIDPFAAGLRPPADHSPPILESLTITAAEPGTFIDGVRRERTYRLDGRGSPEPVRINGPFLASVTAHDPAGAGGRAGLHAIEAAIDGAQVYRLAFRSFRFDQYPLAGLIYDHRGSHLGPARFSYRLVLLPGNELAEGSASEGPAGSRGAYPGALDLSPGAHQMEIRAVDDAGNRARASVCLVIGRPRVPPFLVGSSDRSAGTVRFAFADPPAPEGGTLGRAVDARGSSPRRSPCATPPPHGVEGEVWTEGRFLPVPCDAIQGTCAPGTPVDGPLALRLREVRDGVPGGWRMSAASAGSSDLPAPEGLQIETWPGFLDLLISFPRPLDARLTLSSAPSGEEVAGFFYRDDLTYGAAIDYRTVAAAPHLSVIGPEERHAPLARRELEARFALPSEATAARLGDVTVDMPAGSRFFPGPVLVLRGTVAVVPGLAALADDVDLRPEGESLRVPATLAFRVREGPEADLRPLGIYRWDPVSTRWDYEGGEADPAARSVSLHFRRYGRFALLKDQSPPVLFEVHPVDGASGIERRPRLWARVEDLGMGLDYDGVAFVLDGAPLDSEFDPDRGVARVLDPPALAPGPHRLTVTATDRAGNSSAPVAVSFTSR